MMYQFDTCTSCPMGIIPFHHDSFAQIMAQINACIGMDRNCTRHPFQPNLTIHRPTTQSVYSQGRLPSTFAGEPPRSTRQGRSCAPVKPRTQSRRLTTFVHISSMIRQVSSNVRNITRQTGFGVTLTREFVLHQKQGQSIRNPAFSSGSNTLTEDTPWPLAYISIRSCHTDRECRLPSPTFSCETLPIRRGSTTPAWIPRAPASTSRMNNTRLSGKV